MNTKIFTILPQEAKNIRIEVFMKVVLRQEKGLIK